jgi:DNA primase
MQVNVSRQIWKCFVCDLGGDVFSFLMQKEQLSFPETLAMLAERAGIELPKQGSSKVVFSSDNKRQLMETMQWVMDQYRQALRDSANKLAYQYFIDRGLTEDSIQRFKLGFAPDSWNYLTERFQKLGKPLSLLDQVGVLSSSERGTQYDRFRGRVIFPIFDPQGRPVSLGGRILPGNTTEQAKYVNCSETRLYQKNQTLYGLEVAKESITKSRSAIVMEGYTDVIMASQHGIPNVVAVCGTALGEGHLRLLQRYCDQVILLLDGDEAGQRRAQQILELFMGYPIDLRVISLPDQLDPCDYLSLHGADALREHISNAVDALEFMIINLLGDIDPYTNPHQANAALEQILVLLAKSTTNSSLTNESSRTRQDQMLLRVSKRFGIDRDIVRKRMFDIRERAKSQQSVRRAVQNIGLNVSNRSSKPSVQSDASLAVNNVEKLSYRELTPMERELFEILVHREDLIPIALERFSVSDLQTHSAKALLQAYVECDFRGIELGFDSVMSALEDNQLKSLLVSVEQEASAKNAKLPLDARERLLTLCDKLADVDVVKEQSRRMQQLQSAGLDDEQQLSLLQEILQSARESRTLKIPEF